MIRSRESPWRAAIYVPLVVVLAKLFSFIREAIVAHTSGRLHHPMLTLWRSRSYAALQPLRSTFSMWVTARLAG